MNILHLFPSHYPGGSELCALESIKALEKNGYTNFAIFPTNGEMIDRVFPHCKNVQVIPNNWWMSNPTWSFLLKLKMIKGFLTAAFSIKKYIKKQNIDVVITHTQVIPSGALAAKLSGVPHIWYIHEYGDIDHQLKYNYGKKNTLRIMDYVSKTIVVNSKALERHFKQFFKPEKIIQVYYVVDYPSQQPTPQKKKEALSICMVGRVAIGKNQLIALKALAILKKEGVVIPIEFVGGIDENYTCVLDAFSEANDLAREITFVGQTDTPWQYVNKADCVLVCSKNEAFGRVTVEAMKAGKIVVVSNTGAGKEIIEHGKTGYLFDPENEKQLAAILKQLWMSEDIGSMTQQAYKHAHATYNETAHAECLMQIIHKL